MPKKQGFWSKFLTGAVKGEAIANAASPYLPPQVQVAIKSGEAAMGLGLSLAEQIRIGTIRKKEQ